MVGRSHRYIPKQLARDEIVAASERISGSGRGVAAAPRAPMAAKTYLYRDPEKWRAYMRDYMRRKRAGGLPKTNVPNSA